MTRSFSAWLAVGSVVLIGWGAGAARACNVDCFLFRVAGTDGTNPRFMLGNASHTSSITDFQLTIGDTAYNYDLISNEKAPSGLAYTLVAPDHVLGALRSDLIHYTFNGPGLAPNTAFEFRSNILSDANFKTTGDYHHVLFTLNGTNTSKNAVVTVKFADGSVITQKLPNFKTQTYEGYDILPCVPVHPPIPEPATVAMIGGVGMLGLLRRRRAGN